MSTVNQTSSAVIEPPKLSRRRWGIILILLLAAVVNYLDRANLSIANTTISKEFGFSGTEMGLLLSAFLWPYALANLPAGWLVDRFGPKKMFTGALTLWSAVTFLMGFVNTYSFFYGLRVLLGVAESPFFTSGIKITQSWFSDKERGLPTSIINTGSQIANAIAPPLLTLPFPVGQGLFFRGPCAGSFCFHGAACTPFADLQRAAPHRYSFYYTPLCILCKRRKV